MIGPDGQLTDNAKNLVREAVVETLITLGVNAESPDELLKLQKDFQYLRSWRESIEAAKRQGLVSAILVITGGVLGAIWLALTQAVSNGQAQ